MEKNVDLRSLIIHKKFSGEQLEEILKFEALKNDLSLRKSYIVLICQYQKLSENFIEKYQDEVNWGCVSKYQKLSENFIKKFLTRVNMVKISEHQVLSEEFIRKFKYKVDWAEISNFQNFSCDFAIEFFPYLNWYVVLRIKQFNESHFYKLTCCCEKRTRDAFIDFYLTHQTISEKSIIDNW